MRYDIISRWLCVATIFGAFSASTAHAQEFQSGDPKSTPPPGVDKFYWDLSRSRDRVTRSLAERYLNTVKLSEWSDLSGKFKTYAKYVKHDPKLTTVTIEIARGRGAERTTEEKTIPVEKLSKSSQSRVQQIDAMQKKLKELAATSAAANGGPIGGPGAPMVEGPGVDPRAGEPAAPAGPEAGAPPVTAPAVEAPDPSENEPDPLGFADLPPVSLGPGALGPGGPGSLPPGVTPEGLPQNPPTPPTGPQ